jgi:hypothetical protein
MNGMTLGGGILRGASLGKSRAKQERARGNARGLPSRFAIGRAGIGVSGLR